MLKVKIGLNKLEKLMPDWGVDNFGYSCWNEL